MEGRPDGHVQGLVTLQDRRGQGAAVVVPQCVYLSLKSEPFNKRELCFGFCIVSEERGLDGFSSCVLNGRSAECRSACGTPFRGWPLSVLSTRHCPYIDYLGASVSIGAETVVRDIDFCMVDAPDGELLLQLDLSDTFNSVYRAE